MKNRYNKILLALSCCSLSLLAFLLFSYKSNMVETNITTCENKSMESVVEFNTAISPESEKISPDRITYIEGFYYEPLSEEIISRIYGISYKEDCPVSYDELRYVNVQYYSFLHLFQNMFRP